MPGDLTARPLCWPWRAYAVDLTAKGSNFSTKAGTLFKSPIHLILLYIFLHLQYIYPRYSYRQNCLKLFSQSPNLAHGERGPVWLLNLKVRGRVGVWSVETHASCSTTEDAPNVYWLISRCLACWSIVMIRLRRAFASEIPAAFICAVIPGWVRGRSCATSLVGTPPRSVCSFLPECKKRS